MRLIHTYKYIIEVLEKQRIIYFKYSCNKLLVIAIELMKKLYGNVIPIKINLKSFEKDSVNKIVRNIVSVSNKKV